MTNTTFQPIRAKTAGLFDFNVKLTESQSQNTALNNTELEKKATFLHSRPKRLVFELTNACNLNCRMCGRNDADFQLTTFNLNWIDKFENILDHIEEVTLMGWGEPTMHPQFISILERLSRHPVRKYFCTNGQRLIEPKIQDALFQYKADIIAISLDGATAATNNAIRGKGFDNVVSGLTEVVRRKKEGNFSYPYMNFVFTAMRENLRDIPDIVRLAHQIGLEEVKVVYLTAFSETMQPEILFNQPEQVREVFTQAAAVASELNIRLKLPHIQGEDPTGEGFHKPCYTAWRDLFLGSDGYLRPCMSTPIKFFHIDECDSVDMLWNHTAYQHFRAIINQKDCEPDSCRHCYQSSFANWNQKHAFVQTGLKFSPQWNK